MAFMRRQPYQDVILVQRYVEEAGNNPSIVADIIKNDSIQPHQFSKLVNLFRYTLKRFIHKEINEPWQLLVVSGDSESFAKAVSIYNINKDSQTAGGLNALHLAAMSDEPSQLDNALNLGVPFDSKSKEGLNVLDYAALSGNVAMIRHLLELEQKLGIKLKSNKDAPNALMMAALSGKLNAVKAIEAIALEKERGIEMNANYGEHNIANFALRGNNQQVIKYLADKGFTADLDKQENFAYGKSESPKTLRMERQ